MESSKIGIAVLIGLVGGVVIIMGFNTRAAALGNVQHENEVAEVVSILNNRLEEVEVRD